MAPALELPRSVLLALWLMEGPFPASVVQGDDEEHGLTGDGPHSSLDSLVQAVAGSASDVAAVLPAPGDPLVGPAQAAAAGEAVLLHTRNGWSVALVPQVTRFGSELEPGHLVTWQVVEVTDWHTAWLAVVGTLDDAERDLRAGLRLATEALVQLDVARWRADAAERIALVRDGQLPAPRLPPWLKAQGQRVRVLTQAARLRAIVALATEDDGGAVNLWQADQRSTALREVDRLARRAMSAAATRAGV